VAKKNRQALGSGGFRDQFGLRLAVPLRQMARKKEEKAVKPAVHRITLPTIEARRPSPWQLERD
jgi:hypothetical protein